MLSSDVGTSRCIWYLAKYIFMQLRDTYRNCNKIIQNGMSVAHYIRSTNLS